jgi:hypothetical protein
MCDLKESRGRNLLFVGKKRRPCDFAGSHYTPDSDFVTQGNFMGIFGTLVSVTVAVYIPI